MFVTQLLVSRLSLFKELSAGLVESRDADSAKPRQPMNDPASKEYYYEVLLDSCERLFDNELEVPAFEEQMRSVFGIKVSFQPSNHPRSVLISSPRMRTRSSRSTRLSVHSSNKCKLSLPIQRAKSFWNFSRRSVLPVRLQPRTKSIPVEVRRRSLVRMRICLGSTGYAFLLLPRRILTGVP